jgi:uncharacterized glyoxalase superfamily protein PhnB
MAKPIPEGYHSITPHIVLVGAAEALAFYEQAFGAEVTERLPLPDGKLMHAEMRIGDSVVMLADELDSGDGKSPTTLGGNHSSLMIYCDDVDAWCQRAADAGATVEMSPTDMFWGDRYCRVRDPFGHRWALATRVEELPPEEIMERAEAAMQQAAAEMKKPG